MRPVMTMTMHIGYTEGSLSRELSLKRCNITEDRGGLSVRDSLVAPACSRALDKGDLA